MKKLELNKYELIWKRFLDLIFSTIFLIIASPIMTIIGIAIKLESGCPIIFKQIRIGHFQKPFLCYKFRSMNSESDDTLHRKLIHNMMTDTEENFDYEYYKLSNNSRITKIGKFIRKYSLDELPQFLNVLKGEMSLIGPRPAIYYEMKHHTSDMLKRFNLKPGITGYWQINSGTSINYKDMILMDLYYIKNWSLMLDLKILLKTVLVIFNRKKV